MSEDSGPDTARAEAKTYLPGYQKKIWKDHAEELSMSQSEFIRTMVQAGRRGFGADERSGPEKRECSEKAEQPSSEDATSRGSNLEAWLLDVLAEEPRSWDELVERRNTDIEERLDGVLERLQEENRIRYSGRNGGYVLREGD